MANDINMWNDIEDLEKEGKKKQAKSLLELYRRKFIEGESTARLEPLVDEYRKKYRQWDKYW